MSSSSTLPSTPLHSDTSTPITLEEMLSHLNLTSEKAQGEAKPDAVDANEDEELERFRSEWRREVQSKRQPVAPASHHDEPTHHSQILDGTKRSTSPSKGRIKPKSPVISLGLLNDEKDLTRLGTDPIPAKSLITSAPPVEAAVKVKVALDPQLEALQIYGRAVEAEQSGRLGEAVMQYRKASKIDDNVDRLYARALARSKEYDLNNPILDVTPSSTDIISSSAPTDEPFTFQRHIQLQPDYERLQPLSTTSLSSSRPSLLTSLLNSLPIPAHSTQFLPSIEDLPIPLASLPPELLDPIFLHMDVRSIETFAQTCWRARYLTSHSALWKRLTHYIYKPPFITPPTFSIPNTLKRYNNEYRTFLIEEPRIRFDGCYISLCHYIRPGAGDQWVTVTHMITYHRFLRFYPDGGVISFLTTEMPGEVVPVLRMSLRGKGLHFGRWRLDRGEEGQEADLPVVTEKKGKGKGRGRIVISDLMEPGVQPKYEFEMELSLRQTGRGRWNKLEMMDYRSINLATDESLSLNLKHQKPFYFSKVRSYNPPL